MVKKLLPSGLLLDTVAVVIVSGGAAPSAGRSRQSWLSLKDLKRSLDTGQ